MIPYGRQDITQADIDAVVEVLRSDFLTQGPAVPRFEPAVAGLLRRTACGRRQQRDLRAAHRLPGARPRPGRPALDHAQSPSSPRPTAALYCGARGRLCRHRSAHLQPERRAPRAKSSTQAEADRLSAEGRGARCISAASPATWQASASLAGQLRLPDHRRRLARHRRQLSGRADRQLPLQRHHRLQLPPGQDHHHRRRRHGADQRCRAGRAHGAAAQPRHHARPGADDARSGRALVLPADRAWASTTA